MSFRSWQSYREFSREVKHGNRYIHGANVTEFLSQVLMTSKERIRTVQTGSFFWRAQLGNDWKPVYVNGNKNTEEPVPFPPGRMKPVKFSAPEERANPKGIPYLYLATDKETAMSEVRPWIGSYISVGQFKTLKKLHLIDCSIHHDRGVVFFIDEPSEKEKEQAVWADIDKAFSEPVTMSDKSSDYVPTQIIAELFKNEGFDGVLYKSALSTGFNLVLFDMNSVNIINCFLYEAKQISFSFEETAIPYFVTGSER